MNPNPSDTSVEIRNLATGYTSRHRRHTVTDGINATLHPGELTCLLGPNGAGKSTLLKTLSGFIPPLSGDIIIDHRPIDEYTPAEMARVIGVVLTERVSLDNMSVHELVSLGRSPYTGFWGRLSQEDTLIVEKAIASVGIQQLSRRMVSTLSDGERQKVMIAKALAQQTPVIFLDEPSAFLDYPSKVEIMQLLRRLARQQHKTVFLSTHDLELALQIADRIWLIDRPHGVVTGIPEDLALNGDLGRYFERDGVRFDLTTGLFQIDTIPSRRAILTGQTDDPRYLMLTKALLRHGITVAQDSTTPLAGNIVITPAGYMLDGSRTFDTIAGVIAALEN